MLLRKQKHILTIDHRHSIKINIYTLFLSFQSLIDKVAGSIDQDEFICAICFDEYKDPVIIQCHHSFCRKCITEWIDHDKSGIGTYTCPTCKVVNEITLLQRSFHIEQMRALVEKTNKFTHLFPQCDEHPGEDLRFYCRNCKTSVCRDCKVVKLHQGHDFETLKTIATEMKNMIKGDIENANKNINDLKAETYKIDDMIASVHQEDEIDGGLLAFST